MVAQMNTNKLSTDDTDYTDGSEFICDICDICGDILSFIFLGYGEKL